MITKNKYFLISVLSFLVMYVLFGITNFSYIESFRDSYEDALVDPLSYIFLFSILVSFILLFFSEKIFKLWLRKIISWFLPLSVFLIWAAGSGSSIINPSRTDYAVAIGCALAFITLIFALVQKFYYKR